MEKIPSGTRDDCIGLSDGRWDLGICLVLLLINVVVFGGVVQHDFVSYDDKPYVLTNAHVRAGLTKESVIWAFTNTQCMHWFPLTWLSHMAACQVYDLNPSGHHLLNLLLHIGNTLLLFGVLRTMTGALWRSAAVAACFAVHPLNVESVAWVSERSNVLCLFFWMLTMLAYGRYARGPSVRSYALVVVLFAMALLAKPMAISLPFVLLLMDYWPLHRFTQTSFGWKMAWSLVLEKMPLLVLASVEGVITFLHQLRVHALTNLENLSVMERVGNALFAYGIYVKKMVWPAGLAFFYPHLADALPLWKVGASVGFLVLVSWGVWLGRKRLPYLWVGWLWYVGTLFPMSGLIQGGAHGMADRYAYLPLIGLFIMLAWGLPELFRRMKLSAFVFFSFSAAVLLAWMAVAFAQVGVWRDSITLFDHAARVTQDNYVAHYNLADALSEEGRFPEAIAHYREAARLRPGEVDYRINLGIALEKQGNSAEATALYFQAAQIDPKSFTAHYNVGVMLYRQGKIEDATAHFSQALRIRPDFRPAKEALAKIAVVQKAGAHDHK